MSYELLVDALQRYRRAYEDLFFILSTLRMHPDRELAVLSATVLGKLLSAPDDSDWSRLLDVLSRVERRGREVVR